MPASTNVKIATTASEQRLGDDYGLRKERIQSAFDVGDDNTGPTSNTSPVKAVTLKLNTETAPRRGIRWATPPSVNRLVGFVTERRWQGRILTVDADGNFWARVYDVDEENVDEMEEVQFDSEDVSDLMKDLVKPGGIFFWDIGFQVEPSGQRVRQSVLSFPMIPRVSQQERQAARERAERRFSALGWDGVRHDQPAKPQNKPAS